ncbi:MAG: hypothetical protein KZQ73_14885 [Candidatus Thiodiazotropha sp. (ex Semelilucina semeliformis)]|nr:hypothetical protein [Candidatus Thiodiazotropha sp. (ex Myrtea spinifera)]MCU7809134.1 hypothetical protein [Candidatus Thiodiazotropha sp. (ex Semelilucina semeliformis)]MCU7829300.1 hypothetical protein [Candidatus Thiodiazotropha sp. (ex Myrtea sp. 'scaly one' KF741663)]
MEQMIRSVVACQLAFLMIGCLQFDAVQAADSDYLSAVKADFAEFTSSVFEISPDSPWIGSIEDQPESGGALKDVEGFSVFLQSKSPGSYIFYKKLPTDYKERLHRDYLATGDLDRIKDDIFRYTKELK